MAANSRFYSICEEPYSNEKGRDGKSHSKSREPVKPTILDFNSSNVINQY